MTIEVRDVVQNDLGQYCTAEHDKLTPARCRIIVRENEFSTSSFSLCREHAKELRDAIHGWM